MKRMAWLKRKKTAQELPYEPPIRLGNLSNGEFFHESTAFEQRVRAEILRQADENARYVGMDRREFLASAMGMATSLSVLNMAQACTSAPVVNQPSAGFFDMGRSGTGAFGAGTGNPASGAGGMIISGASGTGVSNPSAGSFSGGTGSSAGRTGGGGAGGMSSTNGGSGGYMMPKDAPINCEVAEDALGGKEFIFDMQTHHIEQQGDWRTTNPTQGTGLAAYFAQYNGCDQFDATICVDAQAYLEHIYLESDTTLSVLSGFPAPLCTDGRKTGCGNALDNDAMWKSRDRFNAMAKSQRMVQHCQVNPTDNLPLQLAIMERIKKEHNCWGFKSYPEWGPDGKGWMLDDPKSGIPFIQKAIELDTKIICAHKGIVFPGWDASCADPKDVGVVAKMFPDVSFVVYHSAIEIDAVGEGVYNPNNTQGVDRLCRTVEQNGLKNMNVFAELGSVWAQVMNTTDKAQHVIGKLLKYVGENNVVWGSECIWFGSPQPQIESFRTFQISKMYQDMYGYPELTKELKAKIFGLNAAKIYKVNAEETRCRIKQTKLAQLKDIMDGELGTRRWAFTRPFGPRTRREFWNLARRSNGRPG